MNHGDERITIVNFNGTDKKNCINSSDSSEVQNLRHSKEEGQDSGQMYIYEPILF